MYLRAKDEEARLQREAEVRREAKYKVTKYNVERHEEAEVRRALLATAVPSSQNLSPHASCGLLVAHLLFVKPQEALLAKKGPKKRR